MEFLKKAFTWIADLSAKLPKADFRIFFIAVAAIIFGVGIVFAFTYLGSKNFKLIKASKNIQKYLEGVDGIDEDNVSDFTARCFSAKAPQPLRDAWVQYLGVRFGYPSDIVSDKNVYDKIVKKNKDFRPAIYICTSLLLLAICVFWGYGVLDKIYIGTVQFVCLAIMGLMFLFLVLINRAQTKQCLEAFEDMQEDLDAKVNLQVEKNYSTDSSPLAELAGIVEEIIARNTSKSIEIDDGQALQEPTPIEALIQQKEDGTIDKESAVAPEQTPAESVVTPEESAAENSAPVQEQTSEESNVAVAESAPQDVAVQEVVEQVPEQQTTIEENTAQDVVAQNVQSEQSTEDVQSEQSAESEDEFVSDVSLEEVGVAEEQPRTTDDESETQADESDDEIEIQLDEVNDSDLSENVEDTVSDSDESLYEVESDDENDYVESDDENESVDEPTVVEEEFASQDQTESDTDNADEECEAEYADEQSAEALDDQTDEDEDESSIDYDVFSIERYLGTENSVEQSQDSDAEETIENETVEDDFVETQDSYDEYTDDDQFEQTEETETVDDSTDAESIDESVESQEESTAVEEPAEEPAEESAEYGESAEEEPVDYEDEELGEEYTDDVREDENDEMQDNETQDADGNAEPEVVYVVDGDEDEEEVVKPAKLVKLPNLVDYMLSKNLPKSMKIQIAGVLVSAYKKFENSKEDRKIVVQCLTKIMRDLQK